MAMIKTNILCGNTAELSAFLVLRDTNVSDVAADLLLMMMMMMMMTITMMHVS